MKNPRQSTSRNFCFYPMNSVGTTGRKRIKYCRHSWIGIIWPRLRRSLDGKYHTRARSPFVGTINRSGTNDLAGRLQRRRSSRARKFARGLVRRTPGQCFLHARSWLRAHCFWSVVASNNDIIIMRKLPDGWSYCRPK